MMLLLKALIFLLIVWGAVVRSTGSGLGCPDWPMCYGQLVPHFAYQTFIEWFHRVLAGLVALATLFVFFRIRRSPELRQRCGRWPAWALGLLGVQIALGGAAVLTELRAVVIAAHMALALLFYGVVLRLAHDVATPRPAASACSAACPADDRTTWWVGWCTLGVVLVQATIGAFVSASHAGLACPDFPLCLGRWWPEFVGPVALHMTHRLGAILTVASVGAYSARLLRSGVPAARGLAFGLLGAVTLQAALGISNVLLGLTPAIDIAHTAGAAGLFAMVTSSVTRLKVLGAPAAVPRGGLSERPASMPLNNAGRERERDFGA